MATKKTSGLARELRKIEAEEERIEKEEKHIESEEERIEQTEDLLHVFEELGLMRWKSYYILTAGAILLLSLTFVAALWVMHDQIADVDSKLDNIAVPSSVSKEWCPAGGKMIVGLGQMGQTEMTVLGIEKVGGENLCHSVITSQVPGLNSTSSDIWWNEKGQTLIGS